MRRDDLMKSDLLSEIVLLSGCMLVLLTVIVALGIALTRTSAPP